MDTGWRRLGGILFRGLVILIILGLISFWLSVNLEFVFFFIITLLLLWKSRNIRLMMLTLWGAISLLVILLIFLQLGYGSSSNIRAYFAQGMLILLVLLFPILSNPQALDPIGNKPIASNETIAKLAETSIPSEERQVCLNCNAIVSRNSDKCSWCGKSI